METIIWNLKENGKIVVALKTEDLVIKIYDDDKGKAIASISGNYPKGLENLINSINKSGISVRTAEILLKQELARL